MEPVLRLVVGLGNPDQKYTGTRHNIGRDFIGSGSFSTQAPGFKEQGDVEFTLLAPVSPGSPDVYLVRPLTYMNESGPAVRKFLQKKGIKPEQIVVVVDEFMIPFGTLRLGLKGSAGGHNGMKSLIEALGTSEFRRLRVGIGPVPEGEDPANFVLKKFTVQEREHLSQLNEAMAKTIQIFIQHGFEKAATFSNKNHF